MYINDEIEILVEYALKHFKQPDHESVFVFHTYDKTTAVRVANLLRQHGYNCEVGSLYYFSTVSVSKKPQHENKHS